LKKSISSALGRATFRLAAQSLNYYATAYLKLVSKFFLFIWFVKLLALRPLLAYYDSEDDCGEADEM
jgi:hypothetical protein